MKIRSVMPFPIGPYDLMPRETAMDLVGQTFPATNDKHETIGMSKIVDVDWRSGQEVYLTIEMEMPDGNLG